jgi:4-hydroxythreonine-4-phosphate dehydrogenase
MSLNILKNIRKLNNLKKIAITIGDPAGIGPEIIIKALNSSNIDLEKFILIGNKDIFLKTALETGQPLDKKIEIIDIPCDLTKIHAGKTGVEGGRLSFLALEQACKMALDNKISAIVTAPLSKKSMNIAGYNYSGQTEVLQNYLGAKDGIHSKAEMLFVANDFRVLLLTRHLSLSKVSEALTKEKIIESIRILHSSLLKNFKVNKPTLAICGLNPHAGEDGLLGEEENKVIIPALMELKQKYRIMMDGPFPADTMWIKASKPYIENKPQPYDAYIACYHDQGLIPVKLLAMDATVNTTINLPVIRTSPSHGTAFDIAGKNIANPESMKSAIKLAYQLI